ncbi:MAG: OmpA family protein [Rhodocyclaceae bacterium]|nr:OmpA family protein [Rhodocyclaceae bacterium]
MSIKTTAMALLIGSLVAACATAPTEGLVAQGSGKATVTQVGQMQNAQFVFCETNRCPQHSQKVLAVPASVETPTKKEAAPIPVAKAPELRKFKVHFQFGKASLDADAKAEVAEITEVLKATNAKAIVVGGRTDPTGGLAYNKKLALRRAETVKNALINAGQPAESITAKAQDPCCDGDQQESLSVMREKRRTDIDVIIQTK